MEFIKPGINIDFIGKRKVAFVFSVMMVLATVFLLIWRGGPNYGVDFSGGVLVQIQLDQKRTPAEIRKALEPVQLEDSIIQEFGEPSWTAFDVRLFPIPFRTGTIMHKTISTTNN